MANGAQALMKTLADAGIEVCFSNPGTSEMHFVAALDSEPRMRAVLALFEGVATGAADGYARMTGKPAATLLHLAAAWAMAWPTCTTHARARSPWSTSSAIMRPTTPATTPSCSQISSPWRATFPRTSCAPPKAPHSCARTRSTPLPPRAAIRDGSPR
ncbi:acetolactate synthase [Pseudomonas sp. BAY1663]|uniref:thiamine pyrophosphate-binding protein n=1 Tax=Pseudomonas sp. BAY1663 TaxID=1439940 RepID=UPI00042DF247|nr:acetolactate synthase [Pseudomonas sp. BAY1663]